MIKSNKVKKILIGFTVVKFLLVWITSFWQISTPHVHRQMDTLGVSFRYYQKFFENEFVWASLIPSVVQSGDTAGRVLMEFPLLNILNSPFFIISDQYKIQFGLLGYLVIVSFLLIFNYRIWSKIKIFDIDMGDVILILPLSSIFISHIAKVIPDTIAILLILLGLGLNWNRDNKKKEILSIFVITLGLLVKPPVAALFSILLVRGFKETIKDYKLIIPLVITVLYYTFGLKWMKPMTDLHVFAVQFRDPVERILIFFENIKSVGRFFNDLFLVRYASIFLIPLLILKLIRRDNVTITLISIIFLQMVFFILFCGDHIFVHQYYVFSLVPIFLILSLHLIKQIDRRVLILICTVFTVRNLEVVYNETKPIYSRKHFGWRIFDDCKNIRKDLALYGDVDLIRNNWEKYPVLGLCTYRRTNSKVAEIGVYKNNKVPKECSTVKRYKEISLVKCI